MQVMYRLFDSCVMGLKMKDRAGNNLVCTETIDSPEWRQNRYVDVVDIWLKEGERIIGVKSG